MLMYIYAWQDVVSTSSAAHTTSKNSHMQHANLVRTSGAGVGSPSSMVALVRGVTKVGGHCQTLRSCVPSPDGG